MIRRPIVSLSVGSGTTLLFLALLMTTTGHAEKPSSSEQIGSQRSQDQSETRRDCLVSDSLETLSAEDNFRFPNPLTTNVSLALTSAAVAAISIGYMISPQVELGISLVSAYGILAFEARGFSLNGRFYLLPHKPVSPFVHISAGPLWKEVNDTHSVGSITSLQFGWDYTADFGLAGFLAVGPILTFVSGESVSGALVQVGLGWRF